MIISAYKNRRIPHKGHLCAICQLQTRQHAVLVHLTHGVSVWLCPTHASEEFQTMRGGRDFVLTLHRAWSAAGCLTKSRSAALDAHLASLNRSKRRSEHELPGSYNWKALRNETEHRAAAGEPIRSIIHDLRERHAHDTADAPCERTVRRWYTDGRWRRGVRTRLRPGFDRRDMARASRAQRERAAMRRVRAAESAPPRPPATELAGRSELLTARPLRR